MQFGDIDYMIRQKDFTYNPVNFKGLPEFVRSIKKDGLRYIIILVSVIMPVYFLFQTDAGFYLGMGNCKSIRSHYNIVRPVISFQLAKMLVTLLSSSF